MDSRNTWIMKCSVDLSFSSNHNKGEQKTQTTEYFDETLAMLTYNTGDLAVHKSYHKN